MLEDLHGKRQHCVEWITPPSPTASPYQSDEEDNDAADAVEGLMAATGLVSTDTLEGNRVEGDVDEEDNEYKWQKYILMSDA
jgi:hypothetical protein